MAEQVPLVDYLVLGDEPHLQANECTACGARFFDRRNACAACGKTDFTKADIATEGVLVDADDDVLILAYGDSQIYASSTTRVTLHGYALWHTETGVVGNTSTYRGGYLVSHY